MDDDMDTDTEQETFMAGAQCSQTSLTYWQLRDRKLLHINLSYQVLLITRSHLVCHYVQMMEALLYSDTSFGSVQDFILLHLVKLVLTWRIALR